MDFPSKPEQELYRLFMETSGKIGVKPVVARIYALLFAEPDDLSLEELAERTGYSLSSVSSVVKLLEQFKKVQRIKKPGSKKVYVRCNSDLLGMMHDQFLSSVEQLVRPMTENLPFIVRDLKTELKKTNLSAERKTLLKNKLDRYQGFLDQFTRIEVMLSAFEEHFRKCKHECR